MIRIPKHLAFFTGLLAVLLVIATLILQKYMPIFLHHTVYYCQELMRSFSVQMPKSLGPVMVIAAAVLGGVVVSKLIDAFVKMYLFRKKLLRKQSVPQVTYALEKKLSLIGKVSIIEDSRPLAFCFGIRQPKIYLSTGMLQMTNQQELEAVLHHEKYHLEHRDSLTHLVASIAVSLFPFFSILTDLMNRYHMKREMNADQAVVKAMKGTTSLIAVMKKFLLHEPTPIFAFAPALAQWDTLELRIKALVKQKVVYPRPSFMRISVSFLSMAVMYGLLIAPVSAIELHDKQEDVMMVCVHGNECASWCKANATVVPSMSKAPNASVPYSSIPSSN